MKKLLSILGTISLSSVVATTVVACVTKLEKFTFQNIDSINEAWNDAKLVSVGNIPESLKSDGDVQSSEIRKFVEEQIVYQTAIKFSNNTAEANLFEKINKLEIKMYRLNRADTLISDSDIVSSSGLFSKNQSNEYRPNIGNYFVRFFNEEEQKSTNFLKFTMIDKNPVVVNADDLSLEPNQGLEAVIQVPITSIVVDTFSTSDPKNWITDKGNESTQLTRWKRQIFNGINNELSPKNYIKGFEYQGISYYPDFNELLRLKYSPTNDETDQLNKDLQNLLIQIQTKEEIAPITILGTQVRFFVA
ncbi:hypothetical protein SSABA_v1c04940 [Spiroplasma sabaudiense Ar-1343]|uniref:Lipoprotein n=1 Tax=Spiroplasma sabaudiense Ar-1343 TaxID=1276257 RepID=W6AA65_9MOLU|nr:lipoprotein [Spiroplasma sabaudiense]AHI53901.1 hypothetical protein SSABA_v1c04940 [Spiroplasma sabaudiense Ar-1343]